MTDENMKKPPRKFSGLWRNREFLLLWSGQTVSVFGSLVGGSALSFVAVMTLSATPLQMGVLQTMELLPAFLIGLVAGAWVDRLRRRPLLIAADIGRALVTAAIPLAAMMGALHIELVFAVALIVSVLTIFFNVSYQSYLPGLVSQEELVEANSKLTASVAVAEVAGFGLAGTLVQILTAPLTILIDAVSFIVSVVSIVFIRKPEPRPEPSEHANIRREIADGLKIVLHHPLLRASALIILIMGVQGGLFGSQVVLYMIRDIGFPPGLLTATWAVGGVSSMLGAMLVPRANRWLGTGRAMWMGLLVYGLSSLCVVLASGPTLLSGVLLVLAQLGDGFYMVYDINQLSLRQLLAPAEVLGRVNATMQILAIGGALVGALLGGVLGEWIGSRWALVLGGGLTLLGTLLLGLSPLRKHVVAEVTEPN
jgi:Na+/melibiose symporter-like transporter